MIHDNITLEEKERSISFKNGMVEVEFFFNPVSYSINNLIDDQPVVTQAGVSLDYMVEEGAAPVRADKVTLDQMVYRYHDIGKGFVPGETGTKSLSVHLELPRKHIEAKVEFDLAPGKTRVLVITSFKNGRPHPIKLNMIRPLIATRDGRCSATGSEPDSRVFFNGYQSWSLARTFTHDERPFVPAIRLVQYMHNYNPVSFRKWLKRPKGMVESSGVSVITEPQSKRSMTIGFVNFTLSHGAITIISSKKSGEIKEIQAKSYLDGKLLRPGAEIASMELYIQFKNNYPRCLDEYATMVGKFMNPLFWKNVPFGYCTWYHYYSSINEVEALKNLRFATDREKNSFFTLDYFQLDDGFQASKGQCGDWRVTSKEKFPNGLKPFVEAVKKARLVPGLWIAPFNAAPFSDLAKAHPDWILRDRKGKPIKGCFISSKFQYAIDPTHPGVLDYLESLVKFLVNDVGFKYIKIDFIYSAIYEGGVYYNQDVTRVEAYRNALSVIRVAAGDDSFILGCGAPLMESVGMVNGMRIGTDTMAKWSMFDAALSRLNILVPGMKYALLNTITRAWMHKKFWINDPDCLLLRYKDSKNTLAEIQLEITLMGMSGGQISISEDLEKLDDESLGLISLLQPPYPEPAHSPDMFINPYPELFCLEGDSGVRGRWKLVALINWKGKARTMSLDLKELGLIPTMKYHQFDFWENEYKGVCFGNDVLECGRVPGHGCKLMRFVEHKSDNVPLLIGSTFHVIQGTTEVREFQIIHDVPELVLSLSRPTASRGSLTIKLPERYLFVDSRGNGYVVHEIDTGIYQIQIEVGRTRDLHLKLQRA
ncbi:MAG: alpha-galactosidase [Promethearchaeota archaeon]